MQNVLSQAAAQIEASFDFGIVNDLMSANRILRDHTEETMGEKSRAH